MTNNYLQYECYDDNDTFLSNVFIPINNDNIEIKENYNMNRRKNVLTFMGIYTSVYLFCEVLQNSPFISTHSHNTITNNTYVYNLLFSFLTTYFLFTFSNIISSHKPNIFIYYFTCLCSAFLFAFLGEIPALQKIVIVKGFWKHLTPLVIIFVLTIAIFVLVFIIKECRTSIRDKRFYKNILKLLFVFVSYFSIFFLLFFNNSKNITYHVHHAIFSGVLSMWFVDWDKTIEMIFHAIMMGIVIEGIDFYGIQELFLFIVNDSPVNQTIITTISFLYIPVIFFVIYFIYKY